MKIRISFLVIILTGVIAVILLMYRTPKGIHVNEKNGLYGISDCDSVIVPTEYVGIEFLDSAKRYAVLKQIDRYADSIYTIFDTVLGEFVFDETEDFCIYRLEKISSDSYKMINPYRHDGHWFSTLNLPKSQSKNATIIPHFNNGVSSKSEFFEAGTGVFCLNPSGTWAAMKDSNPRAFHLLERIIAMSDIESSPMNDLHFAQAVDYFIEEDSRYQGDYSLAMSEICRMVEMLDNDGREDMVNYGKAKLILANISLARTYQRMIVNNPEYTDEYIAWHNLIEALACYFDFKVHNHGGWTYNGWRDAYLEKSAWLSDRQRVLNEEINVMSGHTQYFIPEQKHKSYDDILEICKSYHDHRGDYHPMWNEIYYAFCTWLQVRKYLAESIPSEYSEVYNNVTARIVVYVYGIIKNIHEYTPSD